MKSWLGATFRTFVDFLLLTLLAALVEGLTRSLGYPSLASLPLLALRASLSIFPLTLGGALILAGPTYTRESLHPVGAWTAMLLVSIIALSGGILLRGLSIPETAIPPLAMPRSGVFTESGSRAFAARSWDGDRAEDAIFVDFQRAEQPRMSWSAEVDRQGNAVSVEGMEYAILLAYCPPPPLLGLWGAAIGAATASRLAALDELPFTFALLSGLGFAILAAGAALPGTRARWPLAGLVAGATGIVAAFALDLGLASGVVTSLAEPLVLATGMAPPLLAATAEALIGLTLAALGLLAPKREIP